MNVNLTPPDRDGFELLDERDQRLESAARSIVSMCRNDQFGRGWRPKGIDEIAILLESLGYSNEVVAELWYPDLFALAADVSLIVDKYISDDERTAPVDRTWFLRACKDYALGALYSGPWIIAVVGLAVFGAALWSSLSTPLHLATAIALGVYAAQIVSGFFSQAIARRLTFYFLQENTALMKWTLERFILIATATMLSLALLGWLTLRKTYGDADTALAASFFFGSALFQVSLAPLYTLRKFLWIIAIALFTTALTGITFVALYHRRVTVPWEPAALAVEIGCVGIIVLAVTQYWLNRRAGHTLTDVVPPSARSIFVASLPYAAFGAFYFLSIVLDRFFAGLSHGWPYAYRSGYELGTDVALLAILPVVGVLNVVLESLPRKILKGAQSGIAQGEPFDREMTRFYLYGFLAVILATAAAIALGEVAGTLIFHIRALGFAGANDREAVFVLRYAVIAYGLLMLGLMNAQLLFFLSRPQMPILATACASLITATWAIFSIAFHHPPQTMVFGLLLGVITFVALTTVSAYRTMGNFTFAYYAAY